jgi:DNA processing protein
LSNNLAYWVGFSKVSGIGPAKLRKLLDYFGDLESAWQANLGELAAIGMDKRAITSFGKTRQALDLMAELARIEMLGVQIITWDDETYPPLLRTIADPPFILYVQGDISPRDQWGVAIVGTRTASVYGKEVTRTLAGGLAASGVTIISGLALGIDTEAHQAALDADGRTLAVLGCGVDITYPARNAKLAQRIAAKGALISEFGLGTNPESGNFPRRNRIISGLSLGVVMVEGAEQSGARITIDFALEQGRETFAVPGNILTRGSSGPNKLIQQGAAKLVTSIGDILEELNLTMVEQQAEAQTVIPDTPTEAAILQELSAEPMHIDQLGIYTNLPPAELASTLTMMELKGQVRQVGGMQYVVARETKVRYIVD